MISDGSCDGGSHTTGGRVATALFYCKTADKGGSTTFTKSDVYIKPKNRTVAFFSYMGNQPNDNRMDPLQLTEHSACPVREGEKWATALWMRVDVSSNSPWHLRDPCGVKLTNYEQEVTAEPIDYTEHDQHHQHLDETMTETMIADETDSTLENASMNTNNSKAQTHHHHLQDIFGSLLGKVRTLIRPK